MNNYYWRAIRRIAKRYGIPISKARKRDWQKEVNAERKRRSAAARRVFEARKPKSKPAATRARKISRVRGKRTGALPKRVPGRSTAKSVPTRRDVPKLKIKDYSRIRVDEGEDDSDYGSDQDYASYQEQSYQEQWVDDYETDYPELDDLDNIDDFLDTFEYADSDQYTEPS